MVETKELKLYYYGTIMITESSWFDKYAWCWEQYGPISTRWFVKGRYVYFREEPDFTWYLLKWG